MMRYQVQDLGDGTAWLFDSETTLPVRTGSGEVYTAPIENVQWTAVTMNKRLSNVAETPKLADPEPTPEPTEDTLRDTANLAQSEIFGRSVPALDTYDFETQTSDGLTAAAVSPYGAVKEFDRIESAASLETRLDTRLTNKPSTAAPDPRMALAWEVGSYRNTVPHAEGKVREALNRIASGDLNTFTLTSLLESALRSLESALETAAENPYV
jgi:hypothetical protein